MKKLKQSQIAKQLGLSKSYLSMILSGQRKCPPELAQRLSSLGVVNFEARLSLRGRCPKPLDECATHNGDATIKNLAGEPGFEPGLPGPEPGVLPLDYSPAHQNYSIWLSNWQ